jgi:photosystem II stability/assembly factor-like uncharacterized protein
MTILRNLIISFIFILNYSLFAQQPVSPLVKSFSEHSKMKASSAYGLEWISIGPVVNGARVEAVQAHPDQPGIMYAAFGSGNLWKTINGGQSWIPIFEDQPPLGIGDIALAPSNPNIVYLGTGESLKKPRNFTMPGTGIYRSDDGGDNWTHLGLSDSWHIGEIAVYPDNPDIVVVAVLGHFWSTNLNRGLFRTEDGGKSWDHVLYINEKTGGNDVVFAPSDPSVLYATMWENNPGVSGKKSAIYKSVDTGKTWNKISKGIPSDKNTGRMGIAVSYQDPNKAYVMMDHRNRPKGEGAAKIFKTTNGGELWEKTHDKEQFSLSVIGWYFVDI